MFGLGLYRDQPRLKSSDVSCRVQGARPRVRRRDKKGEALDLADAASTGCLTQGEPSYHPFLHNAPSCGIVNRGDSFRVRRSSVQSGSAMPSTSPVPAPAAAAPPSPPPQPVSSFSVALLGATGVGKTALIDQFMSSECTNAYDRDRDGGSDEQTVCIELDGEESELRFLNITNPKSEITNSHPPDALAVVYSVIDKSSFERAEDELSRLQALDLLRNRCLVLVGNKIDVVRSRAVDELDGMELACSYNAKFIEISVGMNHNCDELLVGILHQLRLKRDSYEPQKEHNWTRNKGIVRASRKVKRTLTKIFGKEDARLRNVTNFRVHN
ncbi:GTP-binding protein RAD [Amphibalanus amphitrite]|uniref:GTP-binding protein RAD n=1 Tax=Amphibalanus amphitrite TaxID=1232801 RepID=A0A6A4WIR2_AMPAM|nr:GTP-binding protein RAD [Amphibalanus amphitrite]